MSTERKKIELSPRLRLGVGRGNPNKILKLAAIFCLTLAAILAANALRLVYQTGQSTSDNPQVLGASDVKNSTPAANEPQIIEYKVAKGDTLFNISQKFNISWTTLAALNNLKSPFALKPGQSIKIPAN